MGQAKKDEGVGDDPLAPFIGAFVFDGADVAEKHDAYLANAYADELSFDSPIAAQRFMAPCAVHIFFVDGDRVLLLRRANTGYEDGSYSVVAGHLDGGEEVIAAAIREAREEVGVMLDPTDIHVIGVMHRRSNDERIDFFVEALRWSGGIVNAEPHKCAELRWAAMDDLPSNVIPYVRRALANYDAQRKEPGSRVWFESYGWGMPA